MKAKLVNESLSNENIKKLTTAVYRSGDPDKVKELLNALNITDEPILVITDGNIRGSFALETGSITIYTPGGKLINAFSEGVQTPDDFSDKFQEFPAKENYYEIFFDYPDIPILFFHMNPDWNKPNKKYLITNTMAQEEDITNTDLMILKNL